MAWVISENWRSKFSQLPDSLFATLKNEEQIKIVVEIITDYNEMDCHKKEHISKFDKVLMIKSWKNMLGISWKMFWWHLELSWILLMILIKLFNSLKVQVFKDWENLIQTSLLQKVWLPRNHRNSVNCLIFRSHLLRFFSTNLVPNLAGVALTVTFEVFYWMMDIILTTQLI